MAQLPPASLQDVAVFAERALHALNRGEFVESESICRSALQISPEDGHLLAVLGLAVYSQGKYSDAIQVFETLTGREPSERSHWMNLATSRRGSGQYEAALAAYARSAQLGENSADFYYNVGLTHLDRLDFESARSVLARAVDLAPRDAEIRFQYAKACYESLHTEEALAALTGWEALEGLNDNLVADIGHRLMNLGAGQPAESTVQRLATAKNLEPRARLTLAQIFERTNRLEEARTIVDALRGMPTAAELGDDLVLLAAQLAQRDGRHEESAALFRQTLAPADEFHRRHFSLFPLAKSLDALGQFEEAFATLMEAHRSQYEHLKLTAPLVAAKGAPAMTITRHGCDARDVATWNHQEGPSTAESPIFIVAFPRSGTTLLELTLDAHPQLQSMDEQPFLHRALDDLIATGHEYPTELGRVSSEQLARIRERYWKRVADKVRLRPGCRLVDKNPLNLLRLPVIRRVFPNARIVLAIRHPFDVLLSCYMQHFRAPDFALLCVDLPTLADAYRRSFDFWYEQVELLKPGVYEVRYETLVDDFAASVNSLADFLEVPRDESMLAPGRHAREKGFISTPSYSQVVQPVNKKSVARWRNYGTQLHAVTPIVEPYLKRWGYAG